MKRRTLPLLVGLGLALAPLVAACSDGGTTGGTTTDTATTADTFTPSDDTLPGDDTVEVDTTPLPEDRALARVYEVDPVTTPELTEVELAHLEKPYGALVGPYARVRSCTLDLDRGTRSTLTFGGGGGGQSIDIVSCVPESKAAPGGDGTYREIGPPTSPATDDGRFAELMMYHHMQAIHDFYKDMYGLTDRDHPLDAVTNIETWVSDCDSWNGVANAAFVPHEALNYFATGLDLGSVSGDAILFSGTGDKNFSLDASVIYHEYTHAMIGATRLTGVFLDDQGINNLPGALNEAYADYFAASTTNVPELGVYSLNDMVTTDFCGNPVEDDTAVQNYARDLTAARRCPDDLVGEVHADSEIFSAALWDIRTEFGKLDGDTIVLYAVLQLTEESDFTSAAATTIQAAQELFGGEAEKKVRDIFEARNLVDCRRVVPVERVGDRDIPFRVEGTRVLDPNPYPGYVPGYMQIGFTVPEGTSKVTVSLGVAAGFGGGGGTVTANGVFKPGSDGVRYDLGFGVGTATNDGAITVALDNATKTITLEATGGVALTPGPWSMALHNTGRRTLRVTHASVDFE
ncbi:MAG: M4 family metallopeptidase [Deltaproteobacteria bacterium]|nr:M4 family metallopeptidase [Deltaproteobacteria bacterium]